MARAKSIHDLRKEVNANDKFAAAGKPDAEGIKLIAENYQTTEDSARAFVQWLKGGPEAVASGKPRGGVVDTWHTRGDLEKGKERLLSDDESAKARKLGKKKR